MTTEDGRCLWLVDREDIEFSFEHEAHGVFVRLADLDAPTAVRVFLTLREARVLLAWLKEQFPEEE